MFSAPVRQYSEPAVVCLVKMYFLKEEDFLKQNAGLEMGLSYRRSDMHS